MHQAWRVSQIGVSEEVKKGCTMIFFSRDYLSGATREQVDRTTRREGRSNLGLVSHCVKSQGGEWNAKIDVLRGTTALSVPLCLIQHARLMKQQYHRLEGWKMLRDENIHLMCGSISFLISIFELTKDNTQ